MECQGFAVTGNLKGLKSVILLVRNRLQPFVGGSFLFLCVNRQMLHPAVGRSTVPMLHAFGDFDDCARGKRNGGLAPIPDTSHGQQHK